MHEQEIDSPERTPQPLREPQIQSEYLRMNNESLVVYLKEQYPEVTPEVWDQLEGLNQLPIEVSLSPDPQLATEPHTHLSYELEMIRIVLAFQAHLEQFFFGDNDTPVSFGSFELHRAELIRGLVYMILLSDVGKAGSRHLSPEAPAPVLNLYTHVIMTPERHGNWLKQHPPSTLPPDLETTIATVQNQGTMDQVFLAGNFSLAPIRLALHSAAEVFKETFPEATPEQIALFEVNETTITALTDLGMSLDTTQMREFWTRAHLQCGQEFFTTEAVPPTHKGLASLALLHHHSQGADPEGLDTSTFTDPRALAVVAFLEFLDKADANCHRSQQKDLELLVKVTENMVMPAIRTRNNQDTSTPEATAYQDTLNFMRDNHLFYALLRTILD